MNTHLHRRREWENTTWLGVPVWKYPSDLFVFQRIIHEIKPTLVIETGTHMGGSALFYATLMDLIQGEEEGRVITIDTKQKEGRPTHERIQYLTGSSVSSSTFEIVKSTVLATDRVMVILDSRHNFGHVYAELGLYSQLVTKGSYIVVEDTYLSGHPVFGLHGDDAQGGPYEAVERFLCQRDDFVADTSVQVYTVSQSKKGILRKL